GGAVCGGVEVEVCFVRGSGAGGEWKHSAWISDGRDMARLMGKIFCRGGFTQIQKVLRHIKVEHQRQPISAAVYIGDQCEEDVGTLYDAASGLGVRVFMFGEGGDPGATPVV